MQNVNIKGEVEDFLKDFKEKMKFWGIFFVDSRDKNFNTLAELEIRPIEREQVLKELEVNDYSEGPLNEDWHGGKLMWVFGKIMKNQEIYIKISMGAPGSQTICISFHRAEHPMNYPFKN